MRIAMTYNSITIQQLLHSFNSDRPFVFAESEYISAKIFACLSHNVRVCRLVFAFLRPFSFYRSCRKVLFWNGWVTGQWHFVASLACSDHSDDEWTKNYVKITEAWNSWCSFVSIVVSISWTMLYCLCFLHLVIYFVLFLLLTFVSLVRCVGNRFAVGFGVTPWLCLWFIVMLCDHGSLMRLHET